MTDSGIAKPTAFVVQRITLQEGADAHDFEWTMMEDVFPTVDTSGEDEPADEHFLLRDGDANQYVWLTRVVYWIHATPTPTWLYKRADQIKAAAQEKVARFGSVTSDEVLYDVRIWRHRFPR